MIFFSTNIKEIFHSLIIMMALIFINGLLFANSINISVPAGDSILNDITIRSALSFTMLLGFFAALWLFLQVYYRINSEN